MSSSARFTKVRSIILSVAMMAALLVSLPPRGEAAEHESTLVNLQILAINDFHGNIATTSSAFGGVGRADFLAANMATAEAEADNSIIVSAGDLIGASPLISALFHDEPTIEAMNRIGLDINGVGNHEFDEGAAELLRMANGGTHPVDGNLDGDGFGGANFEFLAANVVDDATGSTIFAPYTVKTYGGVDVAFIGMTLEGTPSIVTPAGVAGLTFNDEIETVNALIPELQAMGIEAIVVLLHEGGFASEGGGDGDGCGTLSGNLNDIVVGLDDAVDLVIGGHNNQRFACLDVGGKAVTMAYHSGRMFTDIDVTLDPTTGDMTVVSIDNKENFQEGVTPQANVTALIDKYEALAAPLANTVIGSITVDVTETNNDAGESALGDVIADAQLTATMSAGTGNAVAAFMNPGGIRDDMLFDAIAGTEAPGEVTFGEAFSVQPFGNSLVTMTLTGAQIHELLTQQWVGQTSPRILQVSEGFSYTWDANAADADKVDASTIMINGVLVDPAAGYRVTVNSFLADGGDNFAVLPLGTDRLGGEIDLDALVTYFGTNTPVAPGPQNRITRIEGTPAPNIVDSIVRAPIVPDGEVAGAVTDFVINLDRSLDPSAEGRSLATGDTIKITLPDDFINNGFDTGAPGAANCIPGPCNLAVLLQGWPQHPIAPPAAKYSLALEGTHTFVYTALEDLGPAGPGAPGIKQMHLIALGFTNPAAGDYEIVVEAQTGPAGAWETGTGTLTILGAISPSINVTSVFNDGTPNTIYQTTETGQATPLEYDFLLFDGTGGPMTGVTLENSDLMQDGAKVGGVTITAPEGATGQAVAVAEASSEITGPVLGASTARLTAVFTAGSLAGDYVVTFTLDGGNSVSMFVTATPARPAASTVASGLNNPRHVSMGPGGTVYVAEAGSGGLEPCVSGPEGGDSCLGFTGGVTAITSTGQERIAVGIASHAEPPGFGGIGPSDVAVAADGTVRALVGLGFDPAVRDELFTPAGGGDLGQVLSLAGDGTWTASLDVAAFEAANNPDGGEIDSNPNAIIHAPGGYLIVDAGANALLKFDGTALSTVAVFPDRLVPAPPFIPADEIPMQAVPTSVAVGSDGAYYVGQLTGFPFPPGEARVYRIDPGTGAMSVFADGFTNIIDIEFGPDGSLYVLQISSSSILFDEFDGALIRVAPDGARTVVEDRLFAPGGLAISATGDIYVSNCGICPDEGEVLLLDAKAPLSPFDLVFSASADRSSEAALAGAEVSGRIYAFLYPLFPEGDFVKVKFYLDGADFHTEFLAPFDFVSGGTALANQAWDTTTVADGAHTIMATGYLADGTTTSTSATFNVNNAPIVADFLLGYSASPFRTDTLALDGATVRGWIYAYVYPLFPEGFEEFNTVTFYLDGEKFHTELLAPYDLAGGGTARANDDLDTTTLADGEHTVVAMANRSGDRPLVTTATFTVANDTPPPPPPPPAEEAVRFATFNASLNRFNAGDLITDLSTPDNEQAKVIAETIQRIRPEVLLLNEFDFDADGEAARLFQTNYLSVSQNGADPIEYGYAFSAESNTGIPSGVDLNNDGEVGGPDDAFGFGFFPGQFGMQVYSQHPIDFANVRTFQNFLWRDMPGALLPFDPATGDSFYSDEALDVFRLSSKSHWDVPIMIGDETVNFLVSHPTPPVFDGPEDRNGTRNHDEIRFWKDYINEAPYIYDDDGIAGGWSGDFFVIAGDQNSDPFDGDSQPGSAQLLLDDARVNTTVTPSSLGGTEQAALQGSSNADHLGDPAFDTADFGEGDFGPGNLRADYVLPSVNLDIVDSAVFWPEATDPLFPLVGTFPFPSSDHRLVWLDLLPGDTALPPPAVPPMPMTFNVTVENLTNGQPFTPVGAVSHDPSFDLFDVGDPANLAIQELAENGNPVEIRTLLAANFSRLSGAFEASAPLVPAANPGGTGFASTETFQITAVPGHVLTLGFMLICTNDGFSGLDSVAFPAAGETLVIDAMAYDAGTEINTEDFADMVPPCQGLIGASSDDAGTGTTNPALAEDGVIGAHPGITGGDDLDPALHGWEGPVARITIEKLDLVELQILSISDWHAQLDPLFVFGEGTFGGAAELSAYFDRERMNNPNTLTLTAGDAYGAAPPLSSFFDEEPAVQAMRLMGFDADTFGNHNFDGGIAGLQSLIDIANADGAEAGDSFQYVSANLTNRDANLSGVKDYQVFEVGGVHVAVIGVTNPEAPTLVFPGNFGTIIVEDPGPAAMAARAAAEAAGADVFVLLAHMGVTGFDAGDPTGPIVDLANDVNGFDLILGDHTNVEFAGMINGQLVVENRSRGRTYARTTLTVDKASASVIWSNSVFVDPVSEDITPDPEVVALLDPLRAELSALLTVVIGQSTVFIPRADECGQSSGRTCESLIGDVVTDAMRATYGTDFAITNAGGLRADLTCGAASDVCPAPDGGDFDITAGTVLTVLPFGNSVVTLSVTGDELKEHLEQGVSAMPDVSGRFAQVSGLCFTYDIDAAVGSRVTGAVFQAADGTCTGGPVDLTTGSSYTLAENDFTSSGGDGYPADIGSAVTRELLDQVTAAFIMANTPISPTIQGRITCIASGTGVCPTPPTVELSATLDGAGEVPGPGDDDGSGTATVSITGTKVTFSFTVASIDMPTAAHIHSGGAGVSGGVVVDLLGNGTLTDNGDGTFTATGMVDIDAQLASDISTTPADFYVNVHNAAFAPGAIRGNLGPVV